MFTVQQTSTGCQVSAVIGDDDNNRKGGVGELSALQGNWPVLVRMWVVMKYGANIYTLSASSG